MLESLLTRESITVFKGKHLKEAHKNRTVNISKTWTWSAQDTVALIMARNEPVVFYVVLSKGYSTTDFKTNGNLKTELKF